jgi:hypothetical protein
MLHPFTFESTLTLPGGVFATSRLGLNGRSRGRVFESVQSALDGEMRASWYLGWLIGFRDSYGWIDGSVGRELEDLHVELQSDYTPG